jgi:hypothetical protein
MFITADHVAASRVESELVRSFRNRPASDSLLALLGNGTLLVLAVIMFRDDVPGMRIWWWATAVATTVLVRAAWRLKAPKLDISDARFLLGMRVTVGLNGLAWGVGAALLMPWMRDWELAVFVAGLAGVIASAMHTLAADVPSFRNFTLGITAPLALGIMLSSQDQQHLVLATLTVPFALAMLFVHRQVNRGLLQHLRIVDRLSASERTQAKLITELRTALGAVKQLTGLLPICANCKKVRDDFGYWNSVEHYISEHTDARFSHGVCPDCFPKLFPGIPLPEASEELV